MALPPQQFCVRWNSYHTNLQTVFPRLLLTEQFADVTLACESKQLKCHKLVLSACSAYLEQLLVQNPCKHPIVFMKDMRFSEMQALVDFMYKGEVNVTQEELPSLLKSAEALQIRGLCSNDANGLSDLVNPPDKKERSSGESNQGQSNKDSINGQIPTPKLVKKIKQTESSLTSNDVKEETVEEDGLYYGEMDNDNNDMEYTEDDESGKPGGSLGQSSDRNYLRVKPESELFFHELAKTTDYLARLAKMKPDDKKSENDFYKSWLEQNGELEVSLLRASERSKVPKMAAQTEVELIPKNKISQKLPKVEKRRGRPPIFKDKLLDIGDTVLKSDLDQFLEGKEVSSSGLSRKDLERIMMGKFNPNRRYSNEAMWAALMDVKKGGSIYRAAQTHKVPRKSLRNWMKRCHIKSSFPMPQQLKQFVENSKKQKECFQQNAETYPESNFTETENRFADTESFGKHFLSYSNQVSSEDETPQKDNPVKEVFENSAIDMSMHEGVNSS